MHKIPLFAVTMMVTSAPFATKSAPIVQNFPDHMTLRMSLPGLIQVQETKGKYQEEIAKKEAFIAEYLGLRDKYLESQWANPKDPAFVWLWSRLLEAQKKKLALERRLPKEPTERQSEELRKLDDAVDAIRKRMKAHLEKIIKKNSGDKQSDEIALLVEDYLRLASREIAQCRLEIEDLKKKK